MKYAAVLLLATTALGQYTDFGYSGNRGGSGGSGGRRSFGSSGQQQQQQRSSFGVSSSPQRSRFGGSQQSSFGGAQRSNFGGSQRSSFGGSSQGSYRPSSGGGRGVQSLQSSPLPPAGYISPSAYRQQTEPPKPFAYKYEGPDPYGGYSSHESQGDEYGRITGQYTVQNPDGTSRIVKYVADPETGFHAEVDTDEEGTKTSEPANASIRSSAPEDTSYNTPQKQQGYGSGSAYRAAASRKAPAYKSSPTYNAQTGAYNRPTGGYNAPKPTYNRPGAYKPKGGNFPRPGAYNTPAAYNRPGAYRTPAPFARPGAYKASPTYGASLSGANSGAYRGSNQYGNSYKAAASYTAPTSYRAPSSLRAGNLGGNRGQGQTSSFGQRPYY